MFKKILRCFFTITGCTIGYFSGMLILEASWFSNAQYWQRSLFQVILVLLCGIIMFIVSPFINRFLSDMVEHIVKSFQKMPVHDMLFGTIGLIIGLVIATFVVNVFPSKSLPWTFVGVFIDILAAAIGAKIAIKKKDDILTFFSNAKKATLKDKKAKQETVGSAKVLDTSVIIDGRIFDVCQTGFIEGELVIPNFVLQELRHIADSSDALKRNRGRRGLDMLNRIQKELNIRVEISDKDFPDIAEVDSKLLKLAKVLNGKVITNDYNLNKVAEFRGVPVLNINELANAIKPVVLPGEEMNIQIIKDGKESGQGVAYLDDGTMIVVEGGKKHVGEMMNVVVTSVLQTAAGRMIFAREKELYERAE